MAIDKRPWYWLDSTFEGCDLVIESETVMWCRIYYLLHYRSVMGANYSKRDWGNLCVGLYSFKVWYLCGVRLIECLCGWCSRNRYLSRQSYERTERNDDWFGTPETGCFQQNLSVDIQSLIFASVEFSPWCRSLLWMSCMTSAVYAWFGGSKMSSIDCIEKFECCSRTAKYTLIVFWNIEVLKKPLHF